MLEGCGGDWCTNCCSHTVCQAVLGMRRCRDRQWVEAARLDVAEIGVDWYLQCHDKANGEADICLLCECVCIAGFWEELSSSASCSHYWAVVSTTPADRLEAGPAHGPVPRTGLGLFVAASRQCNTTSSRGRPVFEYLHFVLSPSPVIRLQTSPGAFEPPFAG